METLTNIIWIFLTIIIIVTSIYFSLKLKFISLNINKMFKTLLNKEKNTTSFESIKTLLLSLSGKIGVGSISGVALALLQGGIGTIFWIWIISILSAVLAYAETYLGIKYKEKDELKMNKGGPAYYIKHGLNNNKLSKLYAICIIICYIVGFISIQSNTITITLSKTLNVNKLLTAVIITITSAFIIFKNSKKISDTSSSLVPIMTLIYILTAIYAALSNTHLLEEIFKNIFINAFNYKSLKGAFIYTLLIGVKRGIFACEAGVGTTSIASASSSTKSPSDEGYIQMLGTYITSIIICTCTAIIILTTNYNILNIENPNGIEIIMYAFNYHLGNFGNITLFICIFLFAFSTIITGYYYAETNTKFITKNKKTILLLKYFTIIIVLLGSIFNSSYIWQITDFLLGIICLINIYAIIKLRKEIKPY